MLGFNQFVHQASSRREADPCLLPARGDTQAGTEMRLARTAIADQQNRFRSADVSPIGQATHLGGPNLRLRSEAELCWPSAC